MRLRCMGSGTRPASFDREGRRGECPHCKKVLSLEAGSHRIVLHPR